MDNTDASDVLLEIEDLCNSTNVITSSDIGKMSRFILNPFDNLSFFEVILDGVTLINFGMRESNSSGIACDNVRNLVGTNCLFGDFQ
jgi:hypothetical protein